MARAKRLRGGAGGAAEWPARRTAGTIELGAELLPAGGPGIVEQAGQALEDAIAASGLADPAPATSTASAAAPAAAAISEAAAAAASDAIATKRGGWTSTAERAGRTVAIDGRARRRHSAGDEIPPARGGPEDELPAPRGLPARPKLDLGDTAAPPRKRLEQLAECKRQLQAIHALADEWDRARAEIERKLLDWHNDSGIDQIRDNEAGILVTFKPDENATYEPAKWESIVAWAIKSGNLQIVQRRLTSAKVKELRDLGVRLPDGLGLTPYVRLSVRLSGDPGGQD